MDKIRKLGAWLWLYKERILLGIVVGVLFWRVYTAINPPPKPAETVYVLPTSLEDPEPGVLPPVPDFAPKTLIPVDRKELAKRNPFWYYADDAGLTTDEGPDDIGLELRDIQSVPDSAPRARIKSKGRTRYYSAGDVIDGQYKLDSIDSENGTVTVSADEFKKPVTLKKQ